MIINKKNETDLSGFYIIYKGSVNLEKKGWYGISHLMEHLHTKNYDVLQNEFDENGISWNAYTSNNHIVFYFTGLEEYLSKYRDIVVEKIKNFNITEEELIKEKKIVLEEYYDSFTDNASAFYLNYMRRKYGCYNPIGLKEDIESISYQDCLDFFNLQYKNPDMIINISKEHHYENENIIFEYRDEKFKNNWVRDEKAIIEPMGNMDNKTFIIYDQKIENEDIPLINITNSVLSNGLQSPLYQEIREKNALAYYVSCFNSKLGNQNLLRINTMTSPNNIEKVESCIDLIFSNKEKYITKERLDIVKKHTNINKRKSMINRHKSISDILDPNLEKTFNIINDITLDDIYKIYDKYYNIESFDRTTDKDKI